VDDRHVGVHEADFGPPLDQAAALHPAIEDVLMRRGDLLPAAHHRSVEADEQGVVAERRRERLPVARAPRLEHPSVQSADRALVCGPLLVGSGVAVHGSELPFTVSGLFA
jgi:hypothetical protein